jgi:hypothetical protein
MFANLRHLRSAAVLLLLAAPAVAEDATSAISTPGSGQLTMCRSWLLFSTCRDYSNVALPDRISLGDRVPLSFGSNPKEYEFPVARIFRQGKSCVVLDEPAGGRDDGNRIAIASCGEAAESH